MTFGLHVVFIRREALTHCACIYDGLLGLLRYHGLRLSHALAHFDLCIGGRCAREALGFLQDTLITLLNICLVVLSLSCHDDGGVVGFALHFLQFDRLDCFTHGRRLPPEV